MGCTYPTVRYELTGGQKTKNGKNVIVFKKPTNSPYREILIACKQCLQCRIEKAKEWQKRIIAEASLYKHNYFVTLTYDEENVPTKKYVKTHLDEETGEILEIEAGEKMTLLKQDVTDFKKRLLEYFRSEKYHIGIRFFYCGEYGPQTQRPHYHMILFNLPLDDLEFFRLNKYGQPIYKSKLLSKKWGKGFVEVGSVTYESAGYVARYVLKKQHPTEIIEGREPEFIEMSRRPGIGKGYYDKNKFEIYRNDSMLIPKELSDSFYTKPPKYFDKLFDEEEQAIDDIKLERRRSAQHMRRVKEFNKPTSLLDQEQRELEERAIARKMVNLTREL